MDFNFPDDKLLFNSTIYDRAVNGQNNTPINIENPNQNLIEIEGTSYYFTYINGADPGNKGGNSIILNLYESQALDIVDLDYGEPDLVLKVSKTKNSANPMYPNIKQKRFLKEVEALKKCNENSFQNVITIYHDGICRIRNSA